MGRVIAVMNQKGGVGKTTTTLNLGAALAESGHRVLLVDLDSQANLTKGLGKEAASLEQSLYLPLVDPDVAVETILQETDWEGLHLAPSHQDLSGAEVEMVDMEGREARLRQALTRVADWYDYVLIDCLPSLSLLSVNAMNAARELIIPIQAHPFALEGLDKLHEVQALVRDQMNPHLAITGVLITMFDTRTNVSRQTVERLRNDARFADRIFDTIVRVNTRIPESQGRGVPVIHYDTSSHGARAYRKLAREVGDMNGRPPAAQEPAQQRAEESGPA